MIDLLRTNYPAIEARCCGCGVLRLEVFGSATRSNVDSETGDLDVLIGFLDNGPGITNRYIGFIEAMESHFGGKTDTVLGPA